MAGSLPRLPQRLMVKGETLNKSATSRTVRRSGRLSRFICFFGLLFISEIDIVMVFVGKVL